MAAADQSPCESRIRFVLNGAPVEISGVPPKTTLLDWLREIRGLTGTKEGCAEGDCGACTVALRRRRDDGGLETRPANACIALLPMVHGLEVVTVEGISAPGAPALGDALHPVQRSMADGHAAQCGFCTPGFVMSIWSAYRAEAGVEPGAAPSRARACDLLAGNLCRCTGYGPILDAVADAYAAPAAPWEAGADAAASERLAALGRGDLDYAALGPDGAPRRAYAPASLARAAEIAAAEPDAAIVAGATDVGLWVTKHGFDPATLLFLGRIAELRRIDETAAGIEIGAGVSWADAQKRLAALHPDLGELIRRVGGPQIRAAGAIGGNIANGSPIGDIPPPLIALGARLRLRLGAQRREIALEDFFIDYGRQDRRPGELVEAVVVPDDLTPEDRFAVYKISKRFDEDITAALGAFRLRLDGDRVAAARLAYGGMAGTPKRAKAAEAALVGAAWTPEAVEAAAAALAQDFSPMTDQRASAGYRLTVAANLLRKFHIETTAPETATRLVGPGAVAVAS